MLTKRGRWREHTENVKVGELVVVVDDDLKRSKWPLGRVTKTMPSADNVVRAVEVKTKDGVYTRPVAKLCRLEDNC